MMFSRISVSTISVLAVLPLLATATPWGTTSTQPPTTTTVTSTAPASTSTASVCSTGPVQCCNQVQPASSTAASTLLGLLGIVLQDTNVLVGINCSPLSVVGIGGNSCSAQTVCCQDNSFDGLIAIGCTPINIGL